MRKGLLIIFLLSPSILFAQNPRTRDMNWGIHGGIGTDINLGLGLGIKVSAIPFEYNGHPLEIGAEVFYSYSNEISDNGFNEYEEITELLVIGVLGNWLVDYSTENRGFYYILGIGVAGVSVEWLERSETDSSLGEPYGSSGSQQSSEGTTGAVILNLGVAYNFGNSWDLRLELPIMVFLSSYGTSALAPALTLMGGYRW